MTDFSEILIKFLNRYADIENMKKLALIIMISVSGTLLSAEEYTIQTISAQKISSITPAFEKKVEKSALPITKKKEGVCNIVTVGKYPSAKAAASDMKKAKAISKDAFVRKTERSTPKLCDANISVSDKNSTREAKATPSAPSVHTVETPKPQTASTTDKSVLAPNEPAVAAAIPSGTHIVEEKPQSVALKGEPSECKTTPCPPTTTQNVFVYDRNLVRKSDIGDAIEFYKNSPYHSFRPIGLQLTK